MLAKTEEKSTLSLENQTGNGNGQTIWRSIWWKAQLEIRMAVVVFVLGLVLSLVSPHFFSMHNMLNLMDQMVVIGIASLGATLVILTSGIDLSVGSVLGMTGIVLGMSFGPLGTAGAVIAGLAAGAGAGLISGLLVAKAGLAPFVATLGMMAIARSQAYVLSGARSINNLPPAIEYVGNAMFLGIPLNFICLLVLYALMWLFLTRTKAGRSIYAIGSNEEAARVAGIAVDKYKILTYVASGFFAALASVFLSARILSSDPIAGNGLELDTIAAVVIGGASLFGGRGSMIGTLLGVCIMVLIRNGLNLLGVDPYWQGTAIGSVIVAALLLDRFFSSGSRRASK
ncbi:MAG: ABC transporter permease [Deltaproteobacteria bacterium]|nr:ABC transporter permease [Deltaproteobacteria bacterium]